MNTYIIISIIIILVCFAVLFVFPSKRFKGGGKLTTLAGLAFGFILAGIFFGENRLVGYSLMGIGIIFAIADIVRKLK